MAEEPQPKYEKPKVLLVDIPVEAEESLTRMGFNICAASFGCPHEITSERKWQEVYPNSAFPPDFGENDIVVINLNTKEVAEHLCGGLLSVSPEESWRMLPVNGRLDPRPWMMIRVKDKFDRILAHGGIFIIFVDKRISYPYMRSENSTQYVADNYSFLSALSQAQIDIKTDCGTEILLYGRLKESSAIAQLLFKHMNLANYSCNLSRNQLTKYPEVKILPLAVNKFGQPVSAMVRLIANDSGRIFLLPHFGNKTEFLVELFSDFLPNAFPKLFPDFIGKHWIYNAPYELTEISEVKKEIDRIHDEAERREAELREKIDSLNKTNAYLREILTEIGTPLVKAVETLLKKLGFRLVINVDEAMAAAGMSEGRREDLQIVTACLYCLLK